MLHRALSLAQDVLQVTGDLLLLLARGIAWCGLAVISAAGWCGDRAREWQPRLWDRGQDARSETEERRP